MDDCDILACPQQGREEKGKGNDSHELARLGPHFPEEIWRNILLHASPDVFYFLRQTSRTLLHVSESLLTFERCILWRPSAPFHRDGLVWMISDDQQAEARQMLLPTRLCEPCLSFRQVDKYESAKSYLRSTKWCSGCESEHATIFFSSAQRAAPKEQRLCIGREGSACICKHKQLNWALTEVADDRHEQQSSTCEHPVHSDPSKLTSDVSKSTSMFPTFTVGVARTTSRETYREVTFSWKVLAFKHSVHEELTFSTLRQKLKLMSKNFQLGFCPHISLDDDSLLRPFDPIYCGCLASGLPIRHNPILCKTRGRADDCCLCQSTKYSTIGTFLPTKNSEQLASHVASCSDCNLEYQWTRLEDEVFLSVNMWQSIHASDPTDPRWLTLLDSDSIQLKNDISAKHVSWCDDGNCGTSYRRRTHQRLLEIFKRQVDQELEHKREEAERKLAAEKEAVRTDERARVPASFLPVFM